jgi:hypothetical protein
MRVGRRRAGYPIPEDPWTDWPLDEIPCWAERIEIIIVDRYLPPAGSSDPRSNEGL